MAWRRGRLRAGLAGLLAAVAMVGAVGALWLLARDGAGDDEATPTDSATPDRRDADGGATGPRGTVPAAPLKLPGSLGPGAAEAAGAWSAGERAPGSGAGPGSEGSGALRPSDGSGTDGSSVRVSGTTTAEPSPGASPSPSIPATTAPVRSTPPGGPTTTTTGPEAPPTDDSGAAGLGGLLGGVLDVLGVG